MSFDDPLSSFGLQESDDTFTSRRVAKERSKTAETSCMVRSAHEELLESYEERAAAAISLCGARGAPEPDRRCHLDLRCVQLRRGIAQPNAL